MFQPDKLADLISLPVHKPDPQSLSGFIAWLETRNPAEAYNWRACGGECLIGQYQTHIGDDRHYWEFTNDWEARDIPIQRVASALGEPSFPWSTFGAALKRARAYRDAVQP